MRCIVGIVLFLVLYFGSCNLLGEIVRTVAIRNNPQHSVSVGRAAQANALRKYHALVAVGAGAVTILGCSLPTLLMRKTEFDPWSEYEEHA